MTDDMIAEQEPQRPARYNHVAYDVATLNDQIRELEASKDAYETDIDVMQQDIEVLQRRIRNTRRTIKRIEANAEKLRGKRHVVAEAAFRISQMDQP